MFTGGRECLVRLKHYTPCMKRVTYSYFISCTAHEICKYASNGVFKSVQMSKTTFFVIIKPVQNKIIFLPMP